MNHRRMIDEHRETDSTPVNVGLRTKAKAHGEALQAQLDAASTQPDAGEIANERETRGAVHSGNIDRDNAIRNSTSVDVSSPSLRAVVDAVYKWRNDATGSLEHEHKIDEALDALASPQPDAGTRGDPYWTEGNLNPPRGPVIDLGDAPSPSSEAAPPIGETFGPAHDEIWAEYYSSEAAPPSADDKSAINKRVQARWDELHIEGKHGFYETMFQIVHEERAVSHQAGERAGREQAVNIMRRYEENQDLGCPEMMEELHALATDPKEKRDE